MPLVMNNEFETYAEPVVPGKSGERWFRIDASGAIRSSTTGPPDDSSEVVGTSW